MKTAKVLRKEVGNATGLPYFGFRLNRTVSTSLGIEQISRAYVFR